CALDFFLESFVYSVFKVRIWLYQPYQPKSLSSQLVSLVKFFAFPAAGDFRSYKKLALLSYKERSPLALLYAYLL
ncbi:hypothetical protein, partial [Bilifractor sp. HCP3S3_D3]|uniref:hypothetical protein n=1 Tax=Bilifractor sp. HCP3S3_D3 TaxID=3438907 RepID=UPI003F8B358D